MPENPFSVSRLTSVFKALADRRPGGSVARAEADRSSAAWENEGGRVLDVGASAGAPEHGRVTPHAVAPRAMAP